MRLPLEIRFEIYSLCLGPLTLVGVDGETYTQRSCQYCEEDSTSYFLWMWESNCSCQKEKLRDYKMFAVSKTIYKEATQFYFARNEFWFLDLFAFGAFAKKKLHRELVTRIVLHYDTWVGGRFSVKPSVKASKNLLKFRSLSALRLHIESSTVCSNDDTGQLKIRGEGFLRNLKDIEIRVTYDEDLHHWHPGSSYYHSVTDTERDRFSQELQACGGTTVEEKQPENIYSTITEPKTTTPET